MSYEAIVTKITNVKPILGCDNIQLGVTTEGNQIIISKSVQVGTIGVFFDTDGQLDYNFMQVNKLLKEDGGYFEANGYEGTIEIELEGGEIVQNDHRISLWPSWL